MKQALFVISGVAIGLLASLVAVVSAKPDYMAQAEAQAGPAAGSGAAPGFRFASRPARRCASTRGHCRPR